MKLSSSPRLSPLPRWTSSSSRPSTFTTCRIFSALALVVFGSLALVSRYHGELRPQDLLKPYLAEESSPNRLQFLSREAPSLDLRLKAGFELIRYRAEQADLPSNWTRNIFTNALAGWKLNEDYHRSWINQNPTWNMTVITDLVAEELVMEHYGHMPDIVEFYRKAPTFVLNGDLLRYLAVFVHGQ